MSKKKRGYNAGLRAYHEKRRALKREKEERRRIHGKRRDYSYEYREPYMNDETLAEAHHYCKIRFWDACHVKEWRGKVVFDDEWVEIMRNVSIDLGLPYNDVEEIVSVYFRMMREEMLRDEMVSFFVPKIGYINPKLGVLRRYIGRKESERQLYLDIGDDKRLKRAKEILVEIESLTESYHRLFGEKDYRQNKHREQMSGNYVGKSGKKLRGDEFDAYKAKRLTRVTVSEARAMREEE